MPTKQHEKAMKTRQRNKISLLKKSHKKLNYSIANIMLLAEGERSFRQFYLSQTMPIHQCLLTREKAVLRKKEHLRKKDKKPFECPLRADSLFLCVIKQTNVLERMKGKRKTFCVALEKVFFVVVDGRLRKLSEIESI